MKNEHERIFTGTNIIVNGLTVLLDEEKITYLIKDQFESARLAGYGAHMNSVEIHVLNSDIEKANETVKKYEEKINL
ncbi:DUF2007 domain-containing protein [uncultured Polaribacter sp.]|uniref:putative signal transducing protein n=1 Tax=uncultured Polaribacter sp. TaxID=174711 RepID=UPI002618ADEA|nr:DUF2007 domain-containing protein [uncultured Polaribacter sp.]